MAIYPRPLRINIGAGKMVLDSWLSVGLQPTHDVQCDVRKLPFDDESVDEAMAIHVFEHIQRWEALDTLREWRRVLKPGAMLVLELPELMRCCRNVLEKDDIRLGVWGLYGEPGHSDELMVHKWCYSEAELVKECKAAGFQRVKLAKSQWHGRKTMRDMRVECVK